MENLIKLISKLGGLKTEEEMKLYNSIIEELSSSFSTRDIPKKVKQYTRETSYQHDKTFGMCLNCGKDEIEYNSNYCPRCGQQLDWNVENK
jgi:uncharacterized paraquat-inducible protein A